jgi:hypothetical protein
MKIIILLTWFYIINGFKKYRFKKYILNELPFLLGPYNLRITNDNKFKRGLYTQLILNRDDEIKLKTTMFNGFIAYKTSRSGNITKWKNNNNLISNIKKIFSKNSINLINENNEISLTIQFNNINKYSYSILGIEFPEFKYKQDFYNIRKDIIVKQKENTLYIEDNENSYYYIFDLAYPNEKRPFTETQLNTFIFTQIVGIIINTWFHF